MLVHKRRGFTLIELIVVLIIIGILASIGAPMMQGIKGKAICSEAVAGLGAIRTALRQYYIEYHDMPAGSPGEVELYWAGPLLAAGLNVNDLTGTYFSKGCYYLSFNMRKMWKTFPAGSYVQCYAASQTATLAPRYRDTEKIVDDTNIGGYIRMYLNSGSIVQYGISKSGFPEETSGGD